MNSSVQPKRVLIIGAGFAGLNAAKILSKCSDIAVTVLDRRNHHLFQPLLYQVAMAGLSPAEISTPIRAILHANCDVFLEDVQTIAANEKKVRTATAEYNYDYLIVATGATHSYFGHDTWEDYAPGLKTVEQATEIRRRVLMAFELAEKEADRDKRRDLLTFVVIGGGPTGVELAGSLSEISRHTLARDFRHIDPAQARVILIEGAARILAQMSPEASRRATRSLEKLGVTIWTNSVVTDVDAGGVHIGSESIRARTVLWAAGVQPSPLGRSLGVPVDWAGRVTVNDDCSVPGYREVFVVGDLASFSHASDGRPLPGLAPVAIQQGRHVAHLICNECLNSTIPRKPFRYRDKGVLATIGRASAVGQIGRLTIGGRLAWFAWLVIHIYYLIGFQNRLLVLIQWAWSYATYRRGARLIVNRDWHLR